MYFELKLTWSSQDALLELIFLGCGFLTDTLTLSWSKIPAYSANR